MAGRSSRASLVPASPEGPVEVVHYALAAVEHHHHPQGQFDMFLEALLPEGQVHEESNLHPDSSNLHPCC